MGTQIHHARIEFAEIGVDVDQAAVQISHSVIVDARIAGVRLDDSSSQVLNSTFTHFGGDRPECWCPGD